MDKSGKPRKKYRIIIMSWGSVFNRYDVQATSKKEAFLRVAELEELDEIEMLSVAIQET